MTLMAKRIARLKKIGVMIWMRTGGRTMLDIAGETHENSRPDWSEVQIRPQCARELNAWEGAVLEIRCWRNSRKAKKSPKKSPVARTKFSTCARNSKYIAMQ
jgi:hypothetical protein